MTNAEVQTGSPTPLGATLTPGGDGGHDRTGTNFAVFSDAAERVELCLFDDAGTEQRITLPARHGGVHHGFIPGVGAGQRYGYRVHGEWNPSLGLRANATKLLIDPYARAIDGTVEWHDAVWAHDLSAPEQPNSEDSAPFVPRSVVVDPQFDWEDDAPPGIGWEQTTIYEAHVRGLTMTHPDVPDDQRGTYEGFAHPAVIDHLQRLGITAIELLPVHHFIPEPFITRLGLTNYWGYATAGYFAPHAGYASGDTPGDQVRQFKAMVKAFHKAGIEVILDVVYNHTCEGGIDGPSLSLRGLDNRSYYRLHDHNLAEYVDFTGTGNSLNMNHPATLDLVVDSLRYWVTEMRVDGFRFDLAPTLAREQGGYDPNAAIFERIRRDPALRSIKLIAEPWDVGHGGYQVGNFPSEWSEWNAEYRDDIRDFWRGGHRALPSFAYRITGSSDFYNRDGRGPSASINFITAHDGYTMRDLVSYEQRHNMANGEENRDGHGDNRSWNGGVEGETDDPAVIENRRRRTYSLMATLVLSQGVPMISGGDEIGRTQSGNNNAWSQDNPISWHDWASADEDLCAFTARLFRLRAAHPVFGRQTFFDGQPALGSLLDDIGWFRTDGQPMTHDDWQSETLNAITVFLNGNALEAPDAATPNASFLIMFNGTHDPITFTVPEGLWGQRWRIDVDTADKTNRDTPISAHDTWAVQSWSMVMLERMDTPHDD